MMECVECGCSAPDEASKCPGCGVSFDASKERYMGRTKKAEEAPTKAAEKPKKASVVELAKAREEVREDEVVEEKAAENKAAKKLEQLEDKIKKLRTEQQRVEWEIGGALRVIKSEDLWRATGAKGFGEYVQLRFGFSMQTATEYIAIGEMFSKEQATKIPLGHLRLLTRVPNDDLRSKLASQAEREPGTFVEMAEKVRRAREKLGAPTQRGGHEGTVLVNARLKVGPIAQGKWQVGPSKKGGRPVRLALFQIGDAELVIDDFGEDGFAVRLLDLKAAVKSA